MATTTGASLLAVWPANALAIAGSVQLSLLYSEVMDTGSESATA